MRAMVLERFAPVVNAPLRSAVIHQPEPGEGEVPLKVTPCGVWHTAPHTVEGELGEAVLPRIPGHQVVGVVEKRGRGAGRFNEGDRVGAAWLHSACGVCRFCCRGDENLCERARFNGYHEDGGYAEFMKVPEAFAYALPEALIGRSGPAPPTAAGGRRRFRRPPGN